MTWRESTGEEWKEESEPHLPVPFLNHWFDRQGRPITSMVELGRLFSDPVYRIVGRDEFNGYLISTVWLGIDMGFHEGPPVIFETMVFWQGRKGDDQYCERYSTEAEALARHKEIVAIIKRGDWP